MRFPFWLTLSLLAACASNPSQQRLPDQFAPPPAVTGSIAELARAATASAATDESAFWLLASSYEAFEARVAVFDSAVASLDVQYFIWRDDATSWYLLQRLLAAADRGVQVRLLIDDLSASGRDREFYALTQHANIEVRTFNAFRARGRAMKPFEFIFKHGRLNHRMHMKSIVADGQLAMTGGRNIGDRYFGVFDDFIQHDLDVMFAGALAHDAQRGFDAYWNSPLVVSIGEYLRPRRRVDLSLPELREEANARIRGDSARLSSFSFNTSQWISAAAGSAYIGESEYLSDAPDTDIDSATRIKDRLYEFLASAREELIIVTAYFIPDEELLNLLEEARRRGVRVVLLTNSIQSNNHMLAHVAYRPSRKRVLRAGVELFEMRADASILDAEKVSPVEPEYLGLHSKAAVVDRQRAVIGTANLDPRALDINMESVVLIEDAALAEDLRALLLNSASPANAWQLSLDNAGQIVWTNDRDERNSEPVRGPWQRFKQLLFKLLPVRGQA